MGEGGRVCPALAKSALPLKAVLDNLEQMWIALANERTFLSPEQLAQEVETIGRLHVTFAGTEGHTRH